MTAAGTCQICGGVYRLTDTRIAMHGPRDASLPRCAGSLHPPYELSCEAAKGALQAAQEAVSALRAQQEAHAPLAGLDGYYARRAATFTGRYQDTPQGLVFLVHGNAHSSLRVNVPGPAERAAQASRDAHGQALAAQVAALDAESARLADRIRAWHPAPLSTRRRGNHADPRTATYPSPAGPVTVTTSGRGTDTYASVSVGGQYVLRNAPTPVADAFLHGLRSAGENPYPPSQPLRREAFTQGRALYVPTPPPMSYPAQEVSA